MHFRKMCDHLADVLERPLARHGGGTTASGEEVLGGFAEAALPIAEALEGEVVAIGTVGMDASVVVRRGGGFGLVRFGALGDDGGAVGFGIFVLVVSSTFVEVRGWSFVARGWGDGGGDAGVCVGSFQ